ncbi:palmitoyltransferase ZDHHC23-B-like isoform X2 [Ischnura elegans]|uniref:palmitoyltransferase ZDHHC23-B-like isoform X2 n=1 Tax=Ischnura elegans TaxID=197161 RepID=UPI001ED8A07E|nr:palmitoyltransferase ZDHHC23-B-like isoform X2 [Ischnura elegans]
MGPSDVENNPLCCCEYFNLKEERSHLLGCCCDCQELDDNVESYDHLDIECSICRRIVPPRTYHCKACQTCILKMDHHSVWINCCIGKRNHAFFLMAIIFLVSALVYGSNLTLTTVCQPFLFMNVILLPEDCSDVYHEFDIAVCFVAAVYCLLTAILLTTMLIRQCWLISMGITSREWRIHRKMGNIFSCFCVKHSNNNGFIKNWTDFCLGGSK